MSIRDWFRTRVDLIKTKKSYSRHKSLLSVECLEDRLVPVVGVFEPAPIVEPGMGYDGVVRVGLTPDIRWSNIDEDTIGSGALLWTGRHILTAAHVFDRQDIGSAPDGNPDRNNADVWFQMPGKDPIQIESRNITFHPKWKETLEPQAGYDLAILELSEIAPLGANRFDIYRGGDEVGQEFTMVGYGLTGSASTGIKYLNLTKSMGYNTFEHTSANDAALNYYLDNIDSSNHLAAAGDSGGPAIVQGKIAGVIASGIEQPKLDSSGTMSRISNVQDWIDRTIIPNRGFVTFKAENQVFGNDGRTDFIDVKRVGDQVAIVMNGRSHYEPIRNIETLYIRGSSDATVFTVMGDVLEQGFNITVDGKSANDTLYGPGKRSYWDIHSTNDGQLTTNTQGSSLLRFNDVENLNAGGVSRFRFHAGGTITGNVIGSHDKNDTLDYSNLSTTVVVNLATRRASHVGGAIHFIEHVTGGSARDYLYGDHNTNLLIGGAGNDYLFGRGGWDGLLGGAGNDYLDGGRDGIADYVLGQSGRDTFVRHHEKVTAYYFDLQWNLRSAWYWDMEADSSDAQANEDVFKDMYWDYDDRLSRVDYRYPDGSWYSINYDVNGGGTYSGGSGAPRK